MNVWVTPEERERRTVADILDECAYGRAKWRAHHPKKPSAMSRGAVKNRRYRERRARIGAAEYWMIGYDGPSPHPKTSWELIAEHARIYGMKHGDP